MSDLNIVKQKLLGSLNNDQQEVVTNTLGPLLVLAGAGSGKTRSVIHRVAWLILVEGVKPNNILVVTFTNKAASELRERLESMFDYQIRSTWVGTFHSICTKILRLEIAALPEYNSSFTIFDRDNQIALLKKVYLANNIDKKELPIEKVLNIISKQKASIVPPENFFDFQDRNTELIAKIYAQYNEMLKTQNAMDFDDLLMNTAILFMKNPDIKQKYQNIFKYIMIDEYQDTNNVQFKIIKLLAENHQNICVVGDDDQAIYGWRGANIENILSFQKDYDNVRVVKLEQNYRSTQSILDLSNQLIDKNSHRHKKKLWTLNPAETMPMLVSHDNEKTESHFICDDIAEKISKGINPKEIAVLYRTNFQSRIFESMLATKQIPFQVIGSFSFFKRAEIKDILAYLRFLVNPNDMEACMRIINTPGREIGPTSQKHLNNHAITNKLSAINTLLQAEQIIGLKAGAVKAINDFICLFKSIHTQAKDMTIPEIVKLVIKECELIEYFQKLDLKEMTDKVENIKEFITAATEFDIDYYREFNTHPDLNDFLNSFCLQSDVDEFNNKKDTVKLLTMHCAKGLEFEHVYIAGLEEGILPHILCLDSPKEIEEERRLLYVAITRAKKEVQLHYAHSRRIAGKTQYQKESRFLRDIDETTYNYSDNRKGYLYRAGDEDIAPTNNKNKTKLKGIETVLESEKYYQIGKTVIHEEFGKGTILSVDGAGQDAKLTISFDNGLLKKIQGRWVKYET